MAFCSICEWIFFYYEDLRSWILVVAAIVSTTWWWGFRTFLLFFCFLRPCVHWIFPLLSLSLPLSISLWLFILNTLSFTYLFTNSRIHSRCIAVMRDRINAFYLISFFLSFFSLLTWLSLRKLIFLDYEVGWFFWRLHLPIVVSSKATIKSAEYGTSNL